MTTLITVEVGGNPTIVLPRKGVETPAAALAREKEAGLCEDLSEIKVAETRLPVWDGAAELSARDAGSKEVELWRETRNGHMAVGNDESQASALDHIAVFLFPVIYPDGRPS